MAIMGLLLGLSVNGVNNLRMTQDIQTEAQNILFYINKARAYATNEQVGSINDKWVYGYVFTLYTSGNVRGYCIDKWYSTNANSDPTSPNFTFPGTLTQMLNPSINPNAGNYRFPYASVRCPGHTTGTGFDEVEEGVLDNKGPYVETWTSGYITYLVFENLTGNMYMFAGNQQGNGNDGMLVQGGGDQNLYIWDRRLPPNPVPAGSTAKNSLQIIAYSDSTYDPPHIK